MKKAIWILTSIIIGNFAAQVCIKVGEPAMPKLRKLMLYKETTTCSLFIQKEIQKNLE